MIRRAYPIILVCDEEDTTIDHESPGNRSSSQWKEMNDQETDPAHSERKWLTRKQIQLTVKGNDSPGNRSSSQWKEMRDRSCIFNRACHQRDTEAKVL